MPPVDNPGGSHGVLSSLGEVLVEELAEFVRDLPSAQRAADLDPGVQAGRHVGGQPFHRLAGDGGLFGGLSRDWGPMPPPPSAVHNRVLARTVGRIPRPAERDS